MQSENIRRNNVSAREQVPSNNLVQIYQKGTENLKVLFVGNSITYHAPKQEIGWEGSWGMAASCSSNDYVHQAVTLLKERYGEVAYAIVQLAQWELQFYEERTEWKDSYELAHMFQADVVVIRMGENIPTSVLHSKDTKTHIENMIAFFSNKSKAVVVTDSFWKRPKLDNLLKEICEEKGYIYCKISDLEADKKTMALGLFSHEGVSIHPSDYGMQQIAKRIVAALDV